MLQKLIPIIHETAKLIKSVGTIFGFVAAGYIFAVNYIPQSRIGEFVASVGDPLIAKERFFDRSLSADAVYAIRVIQELQFGSTENYRAEPSYFDGQGVQIGPGYRLSNKTKSEFYSDWQADLPKHVMSLLSAYVGKTDLSLKQQDALQHIEIPYQASENIFRKVMIVKADEAVFSFSNSKSLPEMSYAALVSLVLNIGSKRFLNGGEDESARRIIEMLKEESFETIPNAIRNFRSSENDELNRQFKRFREKEAELFEKGLQQRSDAFE